MKFPGLKYLYVVLLVAGCVPAQESRTASPEVREAREPEPLEAVGLTPAEEPALIDTSEASHVPGQPEVTLYEGQYRSDGPHNNPLFQRMTGPWVLVSSETVAPSAFGPCRVYFSDDSLAAATNERVRTRYRARAEGGACSQSRLYLLSQWAIFGETVYLWNLHGVPMGVLQYISAAEWRGNGFILRREN